MHARVTELRQRLRLTDEAVAAMARGVQAAETVLTRLAAWYETNAATWGARLRATAAARRELQAAVRRVNVGPPSEAVRQRLAQAKAALAAAVQAEEAALATLRQYAGTALTDGQKDTWSA